MFKHVSTASLALLAVFLVTPSGSGQETFPDEVELARAVTPDSFLCIVSRPLPEDDRMRQANHRALAAFKNSGFLEEVLDGVLHIIPVADRSGVEEVLQRFTGVVQGVAWHRLDEGEHVFAERVKDGLPNFIFLARIDKAFSRDTFMEIRHLLGGFVLLSDALQLETERYRGTDITSLRAITGDSFSLSVFSRGDLLGFSFGSSREYPRQYLDQLDGWSDRPALIDTRRYKEALRGMSQEGYSSLFIDIDRMIDSMRDRFGRILDMVPEDREEAAVLTLFLRIIEEINLFEYTAEVRCREGNRIVADSRTRFKPGAKNKKLFAALFSGKPVSGYERFIPANALAFSLNSDIDFLPIYELLLTWMKEMLPNADEVLERWEEIQEEIGIDLMEDLLSWFEGGMITVEVPARHRTLMGKTASLTLIHLNASKAVDGAAWLGNWLGKLEEWARKIGIRITLKEVEGEGFRAGTEIYQSIVPFIRPFICIHGDYLVLATGKEDALVYLEFLREGGPSILENERFLSLDLAPPSNLSSIHFKNLENSVAEFKTILGLLGFISMALPDRKKEIRTFKRILGALPRLVPVVEAMDIYSCEAGYSVVDLEAGEMRMKTVTQLKNTE